MRNSVTCTQPFATSSSFYSLLSTSGALSRDSTINLAPHCRAFSIPLKIEKLKALLLPRPERVWDTNNWCINIICFFKTNYSLLTKSMRQTCSTSCMTTAINSVDPDQSVSEPADLDPQCLQADNNVASSNNKYIFHTHAKAYRYMGTCLL